MSEYRNEELPDGELLEFSNLSIKAALEKLRYNLLDIGTRNRLINAPLKNARANALEVVGGRMSLDCKTDRQPASIQQGSSHKRSRACEKSTSWTLVR